MKLCTRIQQHEKVVLKPKSFSFPLFYQASINISRGEPSGFSYIIISSSRAHFNSSNSSSTTSSSKQQQHIQIYYQTGCLSKNKSVLILLDARWKIWHGEPELVCCAIYVCSLRRPFARWVLLYAYIYLE